MGTDFLTSLSDRAELLPSKLHLCSKNTIPLIALLTLVRV